MIVKLLGMYKELSLPQLSKILNKNKTTLQYHLQILKENDIIVTSRESQADSRGSIATKYYMLKKENRDYRVLLDNFKGISNLEERLEKYKKYIVELNEGIKNISDLLSFAEKGIKASLGKIEELNNDTLSKEKLDELHDYLRRINPGFSSIAIPERIYLEELQNVTKFFEGIAKSTEEYFKIEKAKLQKQNVTREEISEIMRTDSKFIEGHEIITIMLPIKELIDISK